MSLDFVTTNADEILDTILTNLENGCGEPLYPGDERRIFGEAALTPLFVALFSAVNDGCRQKLLRYARGEVLDALGENNHCMREQAEKAETTLRFSLATAIGSNVIIPAGLRVTGSSKYFETESTVTIQAGDTYADVTGIAVEGGTAYNGIQSGGITEIVDTYLAPQVSAVTNTTETAGGTDAEDDNSYRERIRSADNALSTAGPAEAYRYFAIAADPNNIADAVVESEVITLQKTLTVYSDSSESCAFYGGNHLDVDSLKVFPHESSTAAVIETDYEADYSNNLLKITIVSGGALDSETSIDIEIDETQEGSVIITPVRYDGDLPDSGLLAKVYAACTDSKVKPLTDKVTVQAPTTQDYDIELTYYTSAADESACITTVEGEGGAIDQYIEWQRSGLKRDINPDYLRKLILAPSWEGAVGATRVEITKPTYVDLGSTVLAHFSGSLTVSHVVKEGVV